MRDKRMRDITVGSLLKVCTCPHIDEDIALVEEFRQLPLPQDTSRMECLLLAVCLEVEARYTVDTVEHTVHPNDIIIVSHNQKTGRSWLSPDCKGIGLLLDYDFFH